MSYDYGRATDRVLVGAAINGEADLAQIKAMGVTHVVDGEIEVDDSKNENFYAAGVDYLWNPTADDGQTKPAEWFKKVVEFAMPPLSRPGAIVLVHCGAGFNRGPSMGYAILRAQGLSPGLSMYAIHTARPLTVAGGCRYAGDADAALKALGWTK